MPTVLTFSVRETDVSRHNRGTSGAPLKPLRDDSALKQMHSYLPAEYEERISKLDSSQCFHESGIFDESSRMLEVHSSSTQTYQEVGFWSTNVYSRR